MARKKILFLISSLVFGGAEKQTIALVNGLDKNYFEVTLGYIFKNEDLLHELDVESLSGLYCFNKRYKFDIQMIANMRQKVGNIDPDIIVCVNPYPLFCVKLALSFSICRAKIVSILHTTVMPDVYHDFLVRVLYKPLINRSDHVVFVSCNQMKYWLSTYKLKRDICSVIHNGIDIEVFTCGTAFSCAGLREKLEIGEAVFVASICAVLRPEKYHTCLIKAGEIIIKKGIPLKILIVGDGPERDKIVECVNKCNMLSHVIFLGFQKDVRPYIAISDVFTIVSSSETFSIAILEAMALGKAIVASDIGGASEQVKNGVNGFLFPPENIEALADRLIEIIREGLAVKMGVKSKRMVGENFTNERMMDAYTRLLLEL